MKNVLARNNFLYFSFDDFAHVMRHRIRLTEKIDGDILQKAVNEAAGRYPYFLLKVERNGEKYEILENDAPITVRNDVNPVTLGTSANNGNFLAVSYLDDLVIFDISHNLTDSKGLFEWIKTVIYLYLTKALGKAIDPGNIRLPGTDFLPGETDDPYEKMELEKAFRLLPDKEPAKAFLPDMRYAESPERSNYVLRVSEEDVMNFSRSQDGSPAAVFCYFTKELIRELYPESKGKPVVCGVPHSFRNVACGEANYHSQTVVLSVTYDDRTDRMSVERQLTCTRGAILLQTDPDNIRFQIRKNAEFAASVDELATIDERRKAYKEGIQSIVTCPETASVSYIGRIDWGGIGEYIRDFALESAAISSPLMLAFAPLDGWFYVTMVLNQTADFYADGLASLFIESGICAEYLYSFPQQLCKVYLP